MPRTRRLHADLMTSARVQFDLGKGKPLFDGKHAVIERRFLRAVGALRTEIHHIVDGVLFEPARKRTALGNGRADEHGEIAFGEAPFPHLRRQTRRRFTRFGKHHHAARRTVEPVHQAQINVSLFFVRRADIFLHRVEQVAIAALVGAGRNVLRFEHYDEVIVLEQYFGRFHFFIH